MRYRTIVADPPWRYDEGFALGPGHGDLETRPLPYASMTLRQIAELPVSELAADESEGARLFLWTTNRYLQAAFVILTAWRFEYRQTLVWHEIVKRERWSARAVGPEPCAVRWPSLAPEHETLFDVPAS